MSSFEFIFTLFGLVFGLALTEVLGGFARAVKRHGPAKLGLLTPVLSLFLLYEIIDFWMNAWNVREAVPIKTVSLLACVVIAGLYYFATVLVWPEDGDRGWEDLDSWALAHKRLLLLSVFGSNVATFAGLLAIGAVGAQLNPFMIGWMTIYFGLILAGAFARGRRLTLVALGLLLAMHLAALVMAG